MTNQALLEHALTLLVRQHGGAPDAAERAQTEAERWRAADARHEAAWSQAQGLWLASDASALRASLPPPPRTAQGGQASRSGRRRVLSVLTIGALAAAGAGGWQWHRAQPLFAQAYTTGRGQQLSHTLPDGSRLVLAPRTELAVRLYRDRRVIELRRGESLFEVRSAAGQPFTVRTPLGAVRVTGTRFSVAFDADAARPAMRVAVGEGRVRVWAGAPHAAQMPAGAAELGAGEQVELRAGEGTADEAGAGTTAVLGPVQPVRVQDVGAWHEGWLVFDAVPLREAVRRWNAYLAEPITLAPDARLAALRITGSYPLRDPGAFIAGLPRALPVRVVRVGGVLRIEPLTP